VRGRDLVAPVAVVSLFAEFVAEAGPHFACDVDRDGIAGDDAPLGRLATDGRLVRGHLVYGLAKAALLHLTESLALELAPLVTVNAIVPGQIASERTDSMPIYKASVIADTPLGRLATEQEVARMAALFCEPDFDFVTGRAIVLDGGRSLPRVPPIGPELANLGATNGA
jgi:NAD(P)-dependent dehydrogenase (short-subunit alcohol dehydrogenase family)